MSTSASLPNLAYQMDLATIQENLFQVKNEFTKQNLVHLACGCPHMANCGQNGEAIIEAFYMKLMDKLKAAENEQSKSNQSTVQIDLDALGVLRSPLLQHLKPMNQIQVSHSQSTEERQNEQALQLSNTNCVTAPQSQPKVKQPSKASVKRFLCPYPKCGQAFRQNSYLQVHKLNHRGIKPFLCKWPSCQFACARFGGVRGHIRNVHFKVPKSVVEQKRQGMPIDNNQNVQDFIKVNYSELEEGTKIQI